MKKYLIAFLVTTSVFIFLLKFDKEVPGIIGPSSKEVSQPQEISLITTGDIGLVRDVNYKIILEKDSSYPFLKIADYLREADLTITNLEGPLIKNCPIIRDGFTFCGEDSNVSGLIYAGIDGASLANNHTTNYGLEGLEETVQILNSKGVKTFGLDEKIEYIQVKDKKIALIGFVELGNNWGGLSNAIPENVSTLTSKAKLNADIVIVSFHWGTEYTYKPTENQISLGRLAINSGADIVLGNHSHWIQPLEVYKEKFIIYAQGNTIFDQDWSQETREGVLYKFIYRNGKFEKIDEKFTIIDNNSQPRFATDEESSKIKAKMPSVS